MKNKKIKQMLTFYVDVAEMDSGRAKKHIKKQMKSLKPILKQLKKQGICPIFFPVRNGSQSRVEACFIE